MKRAIIVGSGGQDGSLLVDLLQRQGVETLGIGRQATHSNGNIFLGPCDVLRPRQVKSVVKSFMPSEVYYLAAVHHASEQIPSADRRLFESSYAVNVRGLLNFLDAIRQFSPKTRIFYAGSSHVFGCPDETPQNERSSFQPVSVYGITKVAGIHCCRYYRETHRIFAAAGIMYNHESVLRRPEFVSQKIVGAALEIKQGTRENLVLSDLEAAVDWGYAPDYVRAMTQILRLDEPEDYVVATGETHTVREFVEVAFSLLGLKWQQYVREEPAAIGRKKANLRGDSYKLRSATGWKPSVTFGQMVKLLVERREKTHFSH